MEASDPEGLSLEEATQLINELRRAQIELEMQKEELPGVQGELEGSRAHHFDLYDLAPAGFFVLSEQGLILETNVTGAALLGVPKDALVEQSITQLILPDDQDIYCWHFKQLFETGVPQMCELRLRRRDGAPFRAQLAAIVGRDLESGAPVCRMVMSDISEHKRTEERLRTSEGRYRAVVEDQTEVISRFRGDGTLTFVNDVYCRFFDKQARKLLGTKWQPQAVAEDLPHIEAKLHALSPSNPVVVIENRVYSGTGQVHWMQFVNRAFFNEAGGLEEIQSVGRDITERKRAEAAVRESDEFSHAVLDSVTYHIAVVDRSGVILAVNEPWHRFSIENGTELGRPARNTGIGVNYLQICRESLGESSEGAMAAHDGIREVLGGALPSFTLEYPCHSSGEQRWFIMSVTRLGSGERGAVISHTDISARRQAEEALRDSEERYRSLFATSMDAVLLTAPDGLILAANDTACRMFGCSEAELIAMGRSGVMDGSDPRLAAALEERSRTGRFRGELTFCRKDGMKFPGEVSSALFVDRFGELRTSMVIRDITLRRRAEEAVRHSRKQLQALARRLVEVQETNRRELAGELHDRVGQNLTALSLNLNMLPELLSPEMLPIIGTWLDDSLRLVTETMDRVRDVMAELRPPGLDDFGLVAALRWYGQEFARRTGLVVAVQCPAPFPRLARELETSLFRIAQEALTNVGKHAHARNVSISADATSAKLVLAITDDGIGFDPAALDPQPGWGLITMRERALAMGWELHFESGSGKGTMVRVEVTNHVHSRLVGG